MTTLLSSPASLCYVATQLHNKVAFFCYVAAQLHSKKKKATIVVIAFFVELRCSCTAGRRRR
jgi:hypothetical protein